MTIIVNSEEWERLSNEEKNCTTASQRCAVSPVFILLVSYWIKRPAVFTYIGLWYESLLKNVLFKNNKLDTIMCQGK